jgi:hypothetical protein
VTHTKDVLAEALESAGLPEMAAKAREGYYHDYLSPLAMPEMQLDQDLVAAIQRGNKAAIGLRQRHHRGEFDASKEESDEWAASPDGQEAFGMLIKDIRR